MGDKSIRHRFGRLMTATLVIMASAFPAYADEPPAIVSYSTDFYGFGDPTFTFASADEPVDLDEARIAIKTAAPATQVHFSNYDHYAQWSRHLFWIGLGGAVVSLVADQSGYVAGRTFGNALWGAGWSSWLGFYGLGHAELSDAADKYNQGIHHSSLRSPDPDRFQLVWRTSL